MLRFPARTQSPKTLATIPSKKIKILKIKRVYILITILLVFFVFVIFLMGYKIPEFPKHRDWIYMPENKDSFFEIEKTNITTDFTLNLINKKGYILLLKDDDYILPTVITETGKIVKRFPKTKDFYIDSLNQRFIFSKEIYKDDTLFKKQLISYSFSDYQKKEKLEIKDFIIEETQAEFLKRKNLIENDSTYYKKSEKFDNEYRKEKSKEVKFYETLFPVTKVSIAYDALNTEFYTNKNGELYTVENTKVKTNNIHKIWNSLYPLFPNYNKKLSIETIKREINTYTVVDKPTIESNFIASGYLWIEIRQNEIEYYSIPFGTKHFKFRYKNKTIAFPNQLNTPKNETDTLACIIDKTLYRIYAKSNRTTK